MFLSLSEGEQDQTTDIDPIQLRQLRGQVVCTRAPLGATPSSFGMHQLASDRTELA